MDSQLVFVATQDLHEIPFTTSKVIAERGKVKHHALQVMISKYQSDLEEFGRVSFEMRPLETEGGLQDEKIYHLNEQQSTLLITYMKNTLPVRKFKKALVKQFYLMQKELISRKVVRAKAKEARSRMTDAIRDYIAESPNKHWQYKHFTDLVYRKAFGKSAKELRLEMCVRDNDQVRDNLTAIELEILEKAEVFVAGLVMAGYQYAEIKTIITNLKLSNGTTG